MDQNICSLLSDRKTIKVFKVMIEVMTAQIVEDLFSSAPNQTTLTEQRMMESTTRRCRGKTTH